MLTSVSSTFSPLFKKLLSQRGLVDASQIASFLDFSVERLEDPFAMKGMKEAAERIRTAVHSKEKILVHGDYDVDGVTGAALTARMLQVLGASFSVFLPDRTEDGYGVSERAIREGVKKGAKLLITVDCGITARKAVTAARELGMDVIIIDHHRIPDDGLPPANVILNPQQSDCAYPFKELSAAGLAFKLAQALVGSRALEFLDLAALSTVCDVAPLVHENRIIVKKGLELLSERKNLGVRALSQSANIKTRSLNTGHVGFMLGPRINAAGRMSSPEIALRLLMTENTKEAESLAQVLEEENRARQKEEKETAEQALSQVERIFNYNRDRVVVAAKEGWHPGVIGIVASRLVERFHRPSIVIALPPHPSPLPEGEGRVRGVGKGSGRSIKGFHLFDALDACKDLFIEFGGHEQAAGLSIKEENITEFRKKVNDYAREKYEASLFKKQVLFDLELQFADLRGVFIKEIELLEPHGAGNPRPVFLTKNLEIKTRPEKIYGDTVKFWVTDGAQTYEALWNDRAGGGSAAGAAKGRKVDLVYSIKGKVWDGVESISLDVKDLSPLD